VVLPFFVGRRGRGISGSVIRSLPPEGAGRGAVNWSLAPSDGVTEEGWKLGGYYVASRVFLIL